MGDTEKPATTVKKITRKETQKAVFEKLSGALAEYKSKLDKKKFESKLNKASKLFAGDIVKAFKKDRKASRKIKAAGKKKAANK
jgi:phage tail tape-measure protein